MARGSPDSIDARHANPKLHKQTPRRKSDAALTVVTSFALPYLRWSAVASRAARNSESLLQPGHWSELASWLPTV